MELNVNQAASVTHQDKYWISNSLHGNTSMGGFFGFFFFMLFNIHHQSNIRQAFHGK